MRRPILFAVAVMAAACAFGALVSTDPGAPFLFAKFFLLGSLSALLPRAFSDSRGVFAVGFVAYWTALALLGFAPLWRAEDAPAWVWAPLGLAWCAALFRLASRRDGGEEREGAAALAACFACCALMAISAIWSTGYSSPSSLAKIVAGSTHQDTYFLGTMAGLTRHFGLPSIGLDGLKIYPYHYYSIAVFAAVEKLTGCSAIQCYALFYPAVWPAVFLLVGMLVARRLLGRTAPVGALGLFLAVLWSGMISQTLLEYMVAWEPLESESYGFATVLYLAGLVTLPLPLEGEGEAALLAPWLVWLAVVALAKISVGLLAFLTLAAALLWRRWRRPRAWLEAALAAAVFIVCHKTNVDPIQKQLSMSFSPFWFPRKYGHGGIKITPVWMVVHWLPLWVGVGLLAYGKRLRDWRSLAKALLEERYVLVALLPAFLLALMGSSLTITGGSGFYFTNLPWVVAMPWAAALFFGLSKGEEERLKPALAIALLVALSCQAYPRLRDLRERVVRGHDRELNGPEARAEMEFLLKTKDELARAPQCGLRVGHDWLWRGKFTEPIECWMVPNEVTGIMERPLYGSFMRPQCRKSPVGYLKSHPQEDEPVGDAAVCAQARGDGLPCVETVEGRSLTKLDCPAN